MHYPEISGRERTILAQLAARHIMSGFGEPMTTTVVVETHPGTPSRKKIVAALRSLVDLGYVTETASWDHGLQGVPGCRHAAWQITEQGLRVALGVIA